MRPGEIRSLSWAAFDRGSWTLRLHAKDAKIGKRRAIAAEGPLAEIIKRRIGVRRSTLQSRDDVSKDFRKDFSSSIHRGSAIGGWLSSMVIRLISR
jgi:integrase